MYVIEPGLTNKTVPGLLKPHTVRSMLFVRYPTRSDGPDRTRFAKIAQCSVNVICTIPNPVRRTRPYQVTDLGKTDCQGEVCLTFVDAMHALGSQT
ncbi:hypothetical protein J6590_093362 [Homalodisca vitripennis]|nr:hypothetical protein J6590_093362 [Homalodisca vitripennis]